MSSEIRYGWKPPISKYLTLSGNSCPNAMDPLRLLRYYLLWYTNSPFLSYGRFMMSFMIFLYCETKTHGPSFFQPPANLIGAEEEYKVDHIVSHKGPPWPKIVPNHMEGLPFFQRYLGTGKQSLPFSHTTSGVQKNLWSHLSFSFLFFLSSS